LPGILFFGYDLLENFACEFIFLVIDLGMMNPNLESESRI